MAVPRTDVCLVDPVAARVTKKTLLSFPGFMRSKGYPRLGPLAVLLAAVGLSSVLFVVSPLERTPALAGCPSSGPCAVNAFLSLDVSAGDPNTVITVTGGQFLPNQDTQLYWDRANHVAGLAHADAGGSFTTRIKPFSGDSPGVHKICASVPPNPCATFTLQAATPTPTASPSPIESPSASPTGQESPSFVATPSRPGSSLSGFDVITRPPFVFLPIFGIGAILLSLAYWAFHALRRPRGPAPLPSAAVVHRATRPDYSAGFGTPTPAPAQSPPASAWSESAPIAPAPPPAATPPSSEQPSAPQTPATPEAPQVEWGTGTSDWGFPEQPEGGPEAPQPGD